MGTTNLVISSTLDLPSAQAHTRHQAITIVIAMTSTSHHPLLTTIMLLFVFASNGLDNEHGSVLQLNFTTCYSAYRKFYLQDSCKLFSRNSR